MDTPQRGHTGSGSDLALPPKYRNERSGGDSGGAAGQAATAAAAASGLVEHATAADVAAAAAEAHAHAPKKPLRVGWAGR